MQAWRLEITAVEVPDLGGTLRRLAKIMLCRTTIWPRITTVARAARGTNYRWKLGLSEAEVARFAIDRHQFRVWTSRRT
jgi:hypothetical protein